MISIIAAIGKNNELGKNNSLIWKLPNDLKFFKDITTNNIIVMGYNTFVSLGRVLPNRTHIVLGQNVIVPEGVILYNTLEELLNYIKDKDVFIIGGAMMYKTFIDLADKLYLTEIDASSDADVYFPTFNKNNYKKTIIKNNSDNSINYQHVLYERIKNER